VEHRAGHALDDELRDPVAALELDRLSGVGVEQRHPDLATVPRVHGSRRIHDRDPVLRGQPRAGMHERGVPVRQRDGHAGRHHRPLAGPEFHVHRGDQVNAGVPGVRPDRQRQFRVQPLDEDVHRVRARAHRSHDSPQRVLMPGLLMQGMPEAVSWRPAS